MVFGPAGGFDSGIEGEQVGLEGEGLYGGSDLFNRFTGDDELADSLV